jgi:hypothetical protein
MGSRRLLGRRVRSQAARRSSSGLSTVEPSTSKAAISHGYPARCDRAARIWLSHSNANDPGR